MLKRKLIQVAVVIVLVLFSFYYTNKTIDIIKETDPLMKQIKEELNKDYENLSQEIVITTIDILKNIKGVYINKYEIEDFIKSIEKYITYLTQFVEISYNKA